MDLFKDISLQGQIIIGIIIVVIFIMILFSLTCSKKNDERQSAIESAGLQPLGKNDIEKFQNDEAQYGSISSILEDFEGYVKTYLPKINLKTVNKRLVNYGFKKSDTVQQLLKDIKDNKKAIKKFDLSPFVQIYAHLIVGEKDQKLVKKYYDLAAIAQVTFMNAVENNIPFTVTQGGHDKQVLGISYRYNPDYLSTGKLNLYAVTEYNKGKPITFEPQLFKNSTSQKCTVNNVCVMSSDALIKMIFANSDPEERKAEIKNNIGAITQIVDKLLIAYVKHVTNDNSTNVLDEINKVLSEDISNGGLDIINSDDLPIGDISRKIDILNNSDGETHEVCSESFLNTRKRNKNAIFTSSEKILANIEAFMKAHLPRIKLDEINKKLKSYGIKNNIQKICYEYRFKDDMYKRIGEINQLYLIYIYDNENSNDLDYGFLGAMSVLKLDLQNDLQKGNINKTFGTSILNILTFNYNSDLLKKNNKLRLYLNTNLNASMPDKDSVEASVNNIDSACYNSKLCYFTPESYINDVINAYQIDSVLFKKSKQSFMDMIILKFVSLAFTLLDKKQTEEFIKDYKNALEKIKEFGSFT
jgi:hypothetical protein